jgi:hypothetical protein
MYEKDYSLIKTCFSTTGIVSLILSLCIAMADSFSQPIQYALGATTKEVRETSNVFLFSSDLWLIPLIIIGISLLSFIMLSYLECYHEDDVWPFPYKRDLNGKKIRKTFIKSDFIDQCYRTTEEFMKK